MSAEPCSGEPRPAAAQEGGVPKGEILSPLTSLSPTRTKAPKLGLFLLFLFLFVPGSAERPS